jgi:hypothetical protein
MNRTRVILCSLALLIYATLPALSAETAVKPEINPPGDIPDSQVFVTYASPSGYSLKVPEGWARAEHGEETVFSDKYNRISVTVTPLAGKLDMALIKGELLTRLQETGHAPKVGKLRTVKLPAGEAFEVAYTENSAPNPVTNKQIRMENERFYLSQGGKLAMLDLSAPQGADNVDQWKLISTSFRWK